MLRKPESRKPSIKGNRHRPVPYACRPVYGQGAFS
jgi:hypothetical protein